MSIPIEIENKLKKLTNREFISEIYPIVLDSDYEDGFIYRYFAKYRISDKSVLEIDEPTYNSLLSKSNKYASELYDIIKIQWKITGPKHDTKIDNRILYGIFDTNLRTTSKAMHTLPGIETKLHDMMQFAKITVDIK